jgi:hypothetical protein
MSTSNEYTGNKLFGHPNSGKRRSFFYVVMISGTGTIEFGDGGGLIPLSSSGIYFSAKGANTTIEVVTTGTYIVHSDNHDGPSVDTIPLFNESGVLTCNGTLSFSETIPCGV